MRGGRNAVLQHLKENLSITSKQAFEEFGVTRLSAVIFDLRHLGYHIDTLMIDGKTRYGESCQYAKYVYKGMDDDLL